MKNISRRTVTKGALWTAPAVVVASAAPAFAASPVPVPTIAFVMDAPDDHPDVTIPAEPPVSDYVSPNGRVRLGIRNVGTEEVPAGQAFSVAFTVGELAAWSTTGFGRGRGLSTRPARLNPPTPRLLPRQGSGRSRS